MTLGKLTPDFHALIGMDLITLGDFSITNFKNSTRIPFAYHPFMKLIM
jgi:hypothetical protein